MTPIFKDLTLNSKWIAKTLFWLAAALLTALLGLATMWLYFVVANYHELIGYDRGVAETRVIAYDPNKCAAPTGGSVDGWNEPQKAITPFQDSEILFWKNP